MRRLCTLIVAVAIASLGLGAPTRAAGTIQPGSELRIGPFTCTAGFVFTSGGTTYVSTAAHCVDEVEQDIADGDGEVFGDVALEGDGGDIPDPTLDWALIRVRPEHVGRVSGAVAGIGALNGYTTDGEVGLADIVQVSGYGRLYSLTNLTRENRVGVVNYYDHEYFEIIGLTDFGDSGGPLVHRATGKAFGTVAQGIGVQGVIGVPADFGPTVQGIVEKAALRGLHLTLRTS